MKKTTEKEEKKVEEDGEKGKEIRTNDLTLQPSEDTETKRKVITVAPTKSAAKEIDLRKYGRKITQKTDNVINHLERMKKMMQEERVPVLINNIQKKREQYGLTQRDIAAYLLKTSYGGIIRKKIEDKKTVPYQQFGYLERGEAIPNISIALRISDIMNVALQEIYQIVYIFKKDYDLLCSSILSRHNTIVPLESIKKLEAVLEDLIEKNSKDRRKMDDLERRLRIERRKTIIKLGDIILGDEWSEIEGKIDYQIIE